MPKTTVTLEEVTAAIERIAARGERPSLSLVRTELSNRGSTSRLADILRSWRSWQDRGVKTAQVVPPGEDLFSESDRVPVDPAGNEAAGVAEPETDRQSVGGTPDLTTLTNLIESLTRDRERAVAARTASDASREVIARDLAVQTTLAQSLSEQLRVAQETIITLRGQLDGTRDALIDARTRAAAFSERAERQAAELETLRGQILAELRRIRTDA